MDMQAVIDIAHGTAVDKGWWETERGFPELIALMHSELSEALDEYRRFGLRQTQSMDVFVTEPGYLWFSSEDGGAYTRQRDCIDEGSPLKPEGIAVELADCVIRIADACGKFGIPLVAALKAKLEYNRTRSRRHGGKLC